jgi:arylsulfatase A-like enzyme
MLGRKLASDVNREFLTWLSGTDEARPFFAFLNYFDAHEPLNPPPPFDRAFGQQFKSPKLTFNRATHWGVWPDMKKLSPPDRQALLDAYDAVVAYEDDQVGRLLDALDAAGKLSNTIVIVTSDHGEAFGEHGEFSHGGGLYWPVLHVPLIVSLPGRVPSHQRVTAPVSLIDLPATITDLTGLSSGSPLPGVSLANVWNTGGSASKAPSPVVSEHRRQPGPTLSVVANDLHYIREHKGNEELYNIAKDPAETDNLLQGASAVEYKEIVEAFRCSIQKDCGSRSQ